MKKVFLSLICFLCAAVAFADSTQLQEALTLLNDGKTDEALNIVKEKALNQPESPDNHMALGLIQLERAEYGAAEDSLKKAIALNKKLVAAHYMLAMIYEKQQDFKSAADKWQKIVKYTKNDTLRELAQKHIKQLEGEAGD